MKTLISGSSGMVQVIILVLLLGAVSGCASSGSTPGGSVLTDNLSEPLNGATTAKFDINVGDGNLTIDRLTGGEQLLAGGTLQYFENQGLPARTLVSFLDQATLTLKASGAPDLAIIACDRAVRQRRRVWCDFSLHTSRYLNRRAWRYFRRLGWRDRYPLAR